MEGKLGLLGPELGPQLQVHLFLEDGAERWEGPRVSWLPVAGSAITHWERRSPGHSKVQTVLLSPEAGRWRRFAG